jgi:hypothetical protein
MQDPGEAVERIFPEGYEDPAIAAAQAQAQAAQTPQAPPNMPQDPNAPGVGAGGQQPGRAAPGTTAAYQNAQGQMQEAIFFGRDGKPLMYADGEIVEARFEDLPPHQRSRRQQHISDAERIMAEEVTNIGAALGRQLSVNGNGRG